MFGAGCYEEVARLLLQLEAQKPLRGMPLATLARALVHTGKVARAKALLPRLLEDAAGDLSLLLVTGRLCMRLDAWPAAIEIWPRVTAQKNQEEASLQLARAFLKLGRAGDAARAAGAVLQSAPWHEEALRIRAAAPAHAAHNAVVDAGWTDLVSSHLSGFPQPNGVAVRALGPDRKSAHVRSIALGFQREVSDDIVGAYVAYRFASMTGSDEDTRQALIRIKSKLIARMNLGKLDPRTPDETIIALTLVEPSFAAPARVLAKHWIAQGRLEQAAPLIEAIPAPPG